MSTCIGCGEKGISEYSHKCDPVCEQAIENARKSHAELGIERKPTFAERLADGFKLVRECGDS